MLANDATFISLALGAVIVVAIAILGSLTLLPALLYILGDNVNRLRVPFLGGESTTGGVWGAISDRVLARPAVLATLTTGALLALAVPFLYLNLGFNQGSSEALPDSLDGKRPLQILEEHFTGGLASPANVVIGAPNVRAPELQSSVATMIARMQEDDLFFAPFETNVNAAEDLIIISVPLSGKVDGEEAEQGITRLREEIILEAFEGTEADVFVGGDTAEAMDFRNKMIDRAPIVVRLRPGAFLHLVADHVPVDHYPGESDYPEPPLRGGCLRGAGHGLPVGLGASASWAPRPVESSRHGSLSSFSVSSSVFLWTTTCCC